MLQDPATTGAVIVTTPEEMPVTETIELIERLDVEAHVDLAAVVVNQLLPELFTSREEALFERLRRPAMTKRLVQHVGPGAPAVLDAAALAVTRRRSRVEHVERLMNAIPEGVEPLFVPFVFARRRGVRSLRQLADAISAELGVEP
jgi:anion-transporting  ArsA/GET3 family ATPase